MIKNLQQKQQEFDRINGLTHLAIAILIKSSPLGHQYFNKELPYYTVMMNRFNKLGGWTTAISKQASEIIELTEKKERMA